MLLRDSPYQISSRLNVRYEKIGAGIPVLFVDDFYARPDDVREAALRLPFEKAPFFYPGRVAPVPAEDGALREVRRKVLELANGEYLSRVPIRKDGARIAAFDDLHTDFAVVDVHPDALSPQQRKPHTDPVAVFGLVYLSRAPRGGTLFFEQTAGEPDGGRGYFSGSTAEYQLRGRIEAAFNRLVIYPGFIPHSAEIEGDWIKGDERFQAPRLTQRFAFIA
ncbi:DUF6445 family protein [Sphingosinicella sp. BN140058]|uniref:DUF6445 family protein n=1 Tax=Sphingosinicella sp. BN140058 TaxID=1892855 RepID=UPI0010131ABE|nr:DUF6445 family protein [Sphingosinicella sp. BN140058]QAY77854.1 hypothetical protein ETR14_15990 [Sphingosinicella sp. BN140058]